MKTREEKNRSKREFYVKNKERILAQMKEYRDNHVEECRARARKYAAEHKKEAIERASKYYLEHKDEVNIKNREWKIKNRIDLYYHRQKPEIKLRTKELKVIHTERNREQRRMRYARNREKEIARTMSHIIEIKPCCEICGSTDRLQRHHWRYDKPLMVNTMCQDCHDIQHTKNFYESRFGGIPNVI